MFLGGMTQYCKMSGLSKLIYKVIQSQTKSQRNFMETDRLGFKVLLDYVFKNSQGSFSKRTMSILQSYSY